MVQTESIGNEIRYQKRKTSEFEKPDQNIFNIEDSILDTTTIAFVTAYGSLGVKIVLKNGTHIIVRFFIEIHANDLKADLEKFMRKNQTQKLMEPL